MTPDATSVPWAATGSAASSPPSTGLDAIERRLLNDFQRDFPLVARPYEVVGERLGIGEAQALSMLETLRAAGFISRVGPVFRPRRLGASTLAAMEVPPVCLECVARMVSACPEVNHNYQREHSYNLWFVVTAADEEGVRSTLRRIEACTGLPTLDLPLETAYHIDLGFDLFGTQAGRRASPEMEAVATLEPPTALEAADAALIAAVQDGLALVPRPYLALARVVGMEEGEVIARLEALLAAGHMKRFGIVVHHRALGYTANAMVVWDVADDRVDAVARRLASHTAVTLCYRRPRRAPRWPYNLFCMIHGRDREQVLATLDAIVAEEGLQSIPRSVLFSTRAFKQRGARYAGASRDAN